jgi:hypothetical protein
MRSCIDNRSVPTLMDHDNDFALITSCKKLTALMPGGRYEKYRLPGYSALIPVRYVVNIHSLFLYVISICL